MNRSTRRRAAREQRALSLPPTAPEEPPHLWTPGRPDGAGPQAGPATHSDVWPVWLSNLPHTASSQVMTLADGLRHWGQANRDTVLRYTAHGMVLVAITATLGLSHVHVGARLPGLPGRESAGALVRVADTAPPLSSPQFEVYARRAVVPRTVIAVRANVSPSGSSLPSIDDLLSSVGPTEAQAPDMTAPTQPPAPEVAPAAEAAPAVRALPIPSLSSLIQRYTVQPGDVLGRIAFDHEVSVEAIVASNPSLNGNADAVLQIGQELTIPPLGGVLHTVRGGETLEQVAEQYKTNVQNIAAYAPNGLKPDSRLSEGQLVFIPGGETDPALPGGRPAPAPNTVANAVQSAPAANLVVSTTTQPSAPSNTLAAVLQPRTAATTNNQPRTTNTTTTTNQAPARTNTVTTPPPTPAPAPARVQNAFVGTGNLSIPVSGYVITQYYWAYHNGVDLAAPIGTPVYASDAGKVIWSGWDNTGYGYMVLIDHGNGFRTRYGHLSWIFPYYGDNVYKGQLIGRVGSTGRSTGPHLHFEVIVNGIARNPFAYAR